MLMSQWLSVVSNSLLLNPIAEIFTALKIQR